MRFELSSVILFLMTLTFSVALILVTTIFARWVRTKLIWTSFGRLLVRMGLRNANGTIGDLKRGQRYLVTKSFVDHFGTIFRAGETLTYEAQGYSDRIGPVIYFHERILNLNEAENAEVLEKIWAFLVPATRIN